MDKRDDMNEELYEKFFALVGSPDEGKRISQAKAAQALGYSSAVVSAYKNRTYNGNIKAFEDAVKAWLKREARRIERLQIPISETAVLNSITKALSIAQDEADIAVIVGEAGTGKTTALRTYAAESHSAVFIEVDSSFTKSVLVKTIAQSLGLDTKGGMSTVISRIVEALKGRDTVILIDEAEYLSDGCLELIRRVINDKAQTGVVLCGLPDLKYKLENRRNDHHQLTSRVGVFLEVKKMSKEDAAKIVGAVWPSLSKQTLEAFVKASKGSVRTLTKLMGRVHQTMAINRLEEPNEEVIEAAGEMLME
ncbi:AAA family ATPase [Treponema phagedenis]|uniref:AAA family ATPase n=1 Tax=Treponema phagedenis TaxID=162 RepID=A0AAE6IWK9_TREPH|nr:AAA family ATPase [Treponema phagedenis]QEJ99487.1 AAA family ATPase [Treponema phagedenis]QEK05058.1 AAA family ATPase [Treponema phagedenis]QEK10679.1 AAA family ATPase [Treponema phagedenis]